MIVEIGLCGAAGFLFLRGIYHSGVLAGWITQGLSLSTQPKAPPPRPPAPAAAPKWDQERYEIDLFLATGAWWLDPNRWGDNPNWREKHGLTAVERQIAPTELPVFAGRAPIAGVPVYEPQTMKRCPNCGENDPVICTAQHGDEETAWSCVKCKIDFTNAGIKKKPKKGVHQRPVAEMPHKLPCGCPSSPTSITIQRTGHTTWTRCGRCEKWWEPRSNDPSGRWLAQGEHVHDKDDIAPHAQAAWDREAKRIRENRGENHGTCPSAICQFPVAKRGGLYYCTNTDCHRYYGGWK